MSLAVPITGRIDHICRQTGDPDFVHVVAGGGVGSLLIEARKNPQVGDFLTIWVQRHQTGRIVRVQLREDAWDV